MNILRYDKRIQALYEAHLALLKHSDPRTGRAAKRLLKAAQELEDRELAGYACHCIAFAACFIEDNYSSFVKHLRMAAAFLLPCENREEMISVYYLIAVDAFHKELFDVAYSYFTMARNLALQCGRDTQAAILDLNIGNILLQTGRYAEARSLFAGSRKGIRQDPSHPHYHANLVACLLNDATACFESGHPEQSERIEKKAAGLIKKTPDNLLYETRFCLALLEARLALLRQDDCALEEALTDLLARAKDITSIAAHLRDLERLHTALLSHSRKEDSAQILHMIDACGIAPEDTQAMRIRNAMQIAALTRADRKKELLEAYREQDRIYARIRAEQKNLYRYLKELVTLISSLRNAQADVMKERETLTHLAETDALTLLANRYALNNHLEVSYERTYKNKKSLCVCLLDLDDLKQYNDTHGHAAGDALLCRFAENLSRLAKEYGLFCARYGGDEFVLIGENKTSVRIGQMLNELRAAGDAKFSAGFCNRVPDDKSRPWDFLARADKNMYASKGRKDFSLIS